MERIRPPTLPARARLAAAVAVYVILAAAVTFPFVVDPANTLTAPVHADVASSVSEFQTLVREHQDPFTVVHLSTIGWPDGVTIYPSLARIDWLNTLFLWIGTLVFGAVTIHSLLFVLGMVITATVTFQLVRHVTQSFAAGFIAGVGYGFWPQMYLIGWAAPTYTWMWLLLLPVWAYASLAMAPTWRSALLAGLSPLPSVFWTPYFALHVSVVTAACVLIVLGRAAMLGELHGPLLKRYAAAAGIPVAGLALYVIVATVSHFGGLPARSVQDAYQESASPLMYVIPGWSSSWGTGLDDFLVRRVPRAQYANLYVGITVMVLAAIALWATARDLFQNRSAAWRSSTNTAAVMAAAVVASCFVFSLPPRLTFGTHSVPMPDDLVIHVQPAFRAGQRFVIPLMSGMVILAGIGAALVVGRLPRRAVPVFVVLAAALVWIDLSARPPEAVNKVPQFASLAVLRAQPPGPVFQFIPLERPDQFQGIRACLLQPQYDKPLADTCDIGNQHQNYVDWTADPDCGTLADMGAAGIRYVIIDDSLTGLIGCMNGDMAGHNRKLADDGRLSVYELT